MPRRGKNRRCDNGISNVTYGDRKPKLTPSQMGNPLLDNEIVRMYRFSKWVRTGCHGRICTNNSVGNPVLPGRGGACSGRWASAGRDVSARGSSDHHRGRKRDWSTHARLKTRRLHLRSSARSSTGCMMAKTPKTSSLSLDQVSGSTSILRRPLESGHNKHLPSHFQQLIFSQMVLVYCD